MGMMMQLRKMANHPALLRYHFTDDQLEDMARRLAKDPTYKETNPDYIAQDLAIMSDFKLHQMSFNHKVKFLLEFCRFNQVWVIVVWLYIYKILGNILCHCDESVA